MTPVPSSGLASSPTFVDLATDVRADGRTPESEPVVDTVAEFDRQLRTLLELGYPAHAGMTASAFGRLVAPLRDVAADNLAGAAAPSPGRVPFVLVVTSALVPAESAMPLTSLKGKPGFVDQSAVDIARFRPLDDLGLPPGPAYLLVDVDRGTETLNVRPNDALVTITAQGRSPLTVDEGIALLTAFPALLAKNNCFSLLGSRCGDKRVPALWISKGAPKLGWCWAGNPHTWLGSASAAGRLSQPAVRGVE